MKATIYFYDLTAADRPALAELSATGLDGYEVHLVDGPVVAKPDATVISPFVSSPVTAELLDAMPDLRLIACRSTGYDNVDLAAAAQRHVAVCNVPSYGENTVAEYAFGLLLALVRKIPQAAAQLRAGDATHDTLQGADLQGKTLGLLGAGRIGCHMAQIAAGFGMTILAYDTRQDESRAKQYGFRYASLDEVLAGTDVLSLHLPSLPETRHLLSADTLAKMKSSAIIINTSRGEVVDTSALIDALTSGRLAGAALDVFEGENIASLDAELRQLRTVPADVSLLEQSLELDTLEKLPNVILTNHNAFNTIEAVARINQTTVDNIAAFLAGRPQNLVGK